MLRKLTKKISVLFLPAFCFTLGIWPRPLTCIHTIGSANKAVFYALMFHEELLNSASSLHVTHVDGSALKRCFYVRGRDVRCNVANGWIVLLLYFVQESALEVFVEWQPFGSRFWQSTQGETPNGTIMAFNSLN